MFQTGGTFGTMTEEIKQQIITQRKIIYSLFNKDTQLTNNFFDENGNIDMNIIKPNIHLLDLRIVGYILKKNNIVLDNLYIGVSNLNTGVNSDYKRFNEKENTMVVQNSYSINIFNCSPIAFYADMTNIEVINIMKNYYKFKNIIFDLSTAKFFNPQQLALPYDKLLVEGGKAYIELGDYGGSFGLDNFDGVYLDRIYSDKSNMIPYEDYAGYLKYITSLGVEAYKKYNENISPESRKPLDSTTLYEILKKINDIVRKIVTNGLQRYLLINDKNIKITFNDFKFDNKYFRNINQQQRKNDIFKELNRIPGIKIDFIQNSSEKPYPIPRYGDGRDNMLRNYFVVTKL